MARTSVERIMIRGFLMLLSFVPIVTHCAWSGPALWSHNSSAAFEMWLLIWVLAIACPIWAWCVLSRDAASSEERKP